MFSVDDRDRQYPEAGKTGDFGAAGQGGNHLKKRHCSIEKVVVWLKHLAKPVEAEDVDDKSSIVDIDAHLVHADALKNFDENLADLNAVAVSPGGRKSQLLTVSLLASFSLHATLRPGPPSPKLVTINPKKVITFFVKADT